MTTHFIFSITKQDRLSIEKILRSTDFFNEEEILVALELVDEKLKLKDKSTYQFILAKNENDICTGYSCYGKVPGTDSSFDLYWIAVHQDFRNHQIGKALLNETEKQVIKQKGLRLYAETSGRKQYHPTHEFYWRNHFKLEARLTDYYSKGDDKLIFVSCLS